MNWLQVSLSISTYAATTGYFTLSEDADLSKKKMKKKEAKMGPNAVAYYPRWTAV
jgi:hypothetical protein